MSLERRELIRQISEPIVEADVTDEIAAVVQRREWQFLNNLGMLFLRFRSLGQFRQGNLVQEETLAELDRLNPENQWAQENGDSKPDKKPVDWSGL